MRRVFSLRCKEKMKRLTQNRHVDVIADDDVIVVYRV